MKMKRKTTKRASTKKKGRKKAPARPRATARPKRKAARTTRRAKRKTVKRKAVRRKPATARRRKARRAKPSRSAATRRKPRRTAKRATPAAKKRATAAKPRRPAVKKRPTPRAVPVRAAEAVPQPVRPREPVGTMRELNFAPPPSGSVEALIPHIEDELRRRGEDAPDPEVVRALATAGAGYRQGPAADPPFDIPVDLDERVAEGFVERYWVGEHSPGPDRKGERETTARHWVRFNLDQVGAAGVSSATVAALAAVALGAWQPNLEPLEKLNVYADLVAGWYRAGAT
jgi:hypothetical protein